MSARIIRLHKPRLVRLDPSRVTHDITRPLEPSPALARIFGADFKEHVRAARARRVVARSPIVVPIRKKA